MADGTLPDVIAELHAVARHAAAATHVILDACERLDAAFAGHAASPHLRADVTRIYEACSFQDIIGQRLGKVMRLLQTGAEGAGLVAADTAPLLEGPPTRSAGLSQAAADALLAGAACARP